MTLANRLAPVFRSYIGLIGSEMSGGKKLSKERFDFSCVVHSEEIFLKTSRRVRKELLGISQTVWPSTRFETAHSLMSSAREFGVMTGTVVFGTKESGA
jgi:hypothetical protein